MCIRWAAAKQGANRIHAMNAHFPSPDQPAAPVREAAAGVARSDARATNAAQARALYQARIPIHPKLVHGRFRAIKWALMIVMLAIYYGVPWLRWDRGPNMPDQAVLIDVANGRFFLFQWEFWPQEVVFITGLLCIAALGLFLVTALVGRVWCGYACPQTIWTDLFILVERAFEGDRAARIRLDKSPWTSGKAIRRLGKHSVWLLIGAATGGAWIFYFHDAPTLLGQLFTGDAPLIAYTFLAILTFTTYALAGLMREQVCTYMCPWPRIQGALIDAETLSVTYRSDRGEPRGAHKKGQPWDGRGDCIDCNQCVAACPMGIDIRDGMQLECINCALCIDACDDVMAKVGRPAGLIAYDTDLNVERRKSGEQARFLFVRGRTGLYVAVLAVLSGLMIFGLSVRRDVEFSVLRDRNPNFVRLADGRIRNGYTLKIVNKSAETRTFSLQVDGAQPSDVTFTGFQDASAALTVESGRVRAVKLYVAMRRDPNGAAQGDVIFTLNADGLEPVTVRSVFVTGEGATR
jgi:cytochrome c oxidase accessory protein FixG